jgi:hypothetical protein
VGLALVALVALPAWSGVAGAKSGTRSPGRKLSPCTSSQVSGTLDLVSPGSSSTSPAGALLFRDVSSATCTLEGAPKVSVVAAAGGSAEVYEFESVPHRVSAVALAAGRSTPTAGSSITWSEWGCHPGSYSVAVRFPHWTSSLTLPSGGTTGYSGPPCTSAGQTVYVGAVARLKG